MLPALLLSVLAPLSVQDDLAKVGPTDPGVTLRVFQLAGPVKELPELAPDQTPNLDQLRKIVHWAGEDFGELPAPIYCRAVGWVQIPAAGEYQFRLTSDDGSRLFVNGEALIRHDGQHGATSKDSSWKSWEAGWYPLLIEHFDSGGARVLRLEWRSAEEDPFVPIPTESLRTQNDLARVTHPGVKVTVDHRKPGLGLPVAGVHPGWKVETIDTGDLVPKVGCMGCLPDGRLVFGTFDPLQRDEVSLPDIDSKPADSLYVYDPVDQSIQPFASGVLEPASLCVVGTDVYVGQRRAIVRFRDVDGDGKYEDRHIVGEGWEGWNYHQFVCGLVEKGGRLYATLSTSMAPPNWEGMETNAGPNGPMRGSVLEVDLATNDVRVIAGGTRTPNGLGLSPRGDLLYSDNQGAWFPTSTLTIVRPGQFYGHYNWARFVPKLKERFPDGGHPSAFCDRMPVPATVLLPHNEVVNSPTQPLPITTGPYAGQVLLGELTAGGVRRVFLENIDGVDQGALFRFTQGLSCGVNRMAWAPDGSLYLGGIGAGGNWNWQGTQSGLQRLVPTGQTVFEMHSVEAIETGFRIRFTQPVDPEWLSNPENFPVQSWTYRPVQAYGGPKINEKEHGVTRSAPAADGLSVELAIADLEAGRCYHIQADPISQSGEAIWSGEAWYTLNRIPALTSAPGMGLGVLPPSDATPLIVSAYPATMRFANSEGHAPPRSQDDFIQAQPYLEVGHGTGDLLSTFTHGDAQLHVEWYCPKGGEDDTRSNSGVYLHGRYEIQIFGTDKGETLVPNSAGTVYGQSVPTQNMSTGPDTWQSYDILFRAPRFTNGKKTEDARLTLFWNGVRVHDNIAITGPTGSSVDEPETAIGLLKLQGYNSAAEGPVRFRNVWIREYPAAGTGWNAGPIQDLLGDPDALVPRGGAASFAFHDGVLTGTTVARTPNTFMATVKRYGDFDLTYEVRTHPELNSGLQIRSEVLGSFENRQGNLQGYQVELDPSPRSWTAGIYEEAGRGWLHPLHAAPYARRAFRQGDWNRVRVLATGPRIQTWINGIPAADLFDASRPDGHFGFQVHGVGERADPLTVSWRNVQLRELTRP